MIQTEAILKHLREIGPITPLEALDRYGCLRLGARIWDLKQGGYNIQSDFYELPNGKRVARYWLPQPKGQLDLWGNKFERSSDGVGHRAEGYN